ncbi:serine aminopeptidase domain-containing protein [Shigella flexneri]
MPQGRYCPRCVRRHKDILAVSGDEPDVSTAKGLEYKRKRVCCLHDRPAMDFSERAKEAEFIGVDGIPVRFVRFSSRRHDSVIVVCPGRVESYVKYAELAYDLFQTALMCYFDHRGRGAPAHVGLTPIAATWRNLATYVDNLAAFWRQRVLPGHWRSDLFSLTRWAVPSPRSFYSVIRSCDAIALFAPMFGIFMRLPKSVVRPLLDWADGHQRLREGMQWERADGTRCRLH